MSFLFSYSDSFLLTAGVEILLDVLTSNGDGINSTSGEKCVIYKTLCVLRLINSMF